MFEKEPFKRPTLHPKLRLIDSSAQATLLQGNLNSTSLVEGYNGRRYLIRKENPEGRAKELPYVDAEYTGVGFFENPNNRFFIRTTREQHEFSQHLDQQGVPVVVPIFSDGDTQVIEYIEGATTLADMLKTNNPNAILATDVVISSLSAAHEKNVVIGDRWGPNELILPTGELRFIDFDIGISGPEAKEFEMASLLYFASYFAQLGSSDLLPGLANLYKQSLKSNAFKKVYNSEMLTNYIKRYAQYFSTAEKYSWQNAQACVQFFDFVTAS